MERQTQFKGKIHMDSPEKMFSLFKIVTLAWNDGVLSKSGALRSIIELIRFNQAL